MKQLLLLSLVWFSLVVSAQNEHMNTDQIGIIIKQKVDTITGITGNWKFLYHKVPMYCITDSKNNRMRIISPIVASQSLSEEIILDALTANFHSALDVKYAISQGILWSAYIHPLKELTKNQLESALSQVYYANINFGTTYSSTPLIFGGKNTDNNPPPEEEIKNNKTQKF
ncbi:hypothetical protein [Aquimarina pacifica]|uniref:hypothetical protein n=1 Tax=Aquimarina pacifica TaxID=1296415 RepID=UPI0004B8318E|nr:hypothetical protein [Aquimarina pacifica]